MYTVIIHGADGKRKLPYVLKTWHNVWGRILVNQSEIIIDEHYQGLNPMQLGQERCAPSHSYGPAVRTHWLLHYVVSGCGRFIKNGQTHFVNSGDTFIIAPYEQTYYEADAQDPWHYIWLGFTGDPPCDLNVAVLHKPQLGDVFADALQCKGMSSGKSAFLAGKLWQIIAIILEDDRHENDYVSQAIHCMKLEYADGVTVSEIAGRLNLSRSYFSTLFKERTGKSPQDYLTALRIEKAIELMTQYAMPPSVVAVSTGYADVYNFSRMFKRYTGVSPRAYIQKQEK